MAVSASSTKCDHRSAHTSSVHKSCGLYADPSGASSRIGLVTIPHRAERIESNGQRMVEDSPSIRVR